MKRNTLKSFSKWVCWLIVFTLVVNCLSMYDKAETTDQ